MARDRAGRPKRLFFALWPDAELRGRLAQGTRKALRKVNGRRVAAEQLHVTLLFLGDADAERQACIERAADGVVAAPFTLTLDHYDYWFRPRVFLLGAHETPAALAGLVEGLATTLAACGHEAEGRPYQPHLTLARKAQPPKVTAAGEVTAEPLAWPVTEFALVESRLAMKGVSYHVLRRWSLHGSE